MKPRVLKSIIKELVLEIINTPKNEPGSFFASIASSFQDLYDEMHSAPAFTDVDEAYKTIHVGMDFLVSIDKNLILSILDDVKKNPPPAMDLGDFSKRKPKIHKSQKSSKNPNAKFQLSKETENFDLAFKRVIEDLHKLFSWWCVKFDNIEGITKKRDGRSKKFGETLKATYDLLKKVIGDIVWYGNYASAKNNIDRFDLLFNSLSDQIDDLFGKQSTHKYNFRTASIDPPH